MTSPEVGDFKVLTRFGQSLPVADPDLQISGGGGGRGEAVLKKNCFGPSGLCFVQK